MSDGNQIFTLYKYGIPRAEVNFTLAEVLVRKRDIQTGDFPDYSKFDEKDAHFYEFPLGQIKDLIDEINAFDFSSKSEVTLGSGAHYHRYKKIEGKVSGKDSEAWLWVQREVKHPIDIVLCCGKVVGFIKMRRDGCLMLVKNGYEAMTPLKAYNDELLSSASHLVKPIGTFNIPMRDGVKLATDVYLPSNLKPGEKVPTILIRTIYGRRAFTEPELRFVFRGYALVAQDCRGRGDSEGDWMPNVYEMDDGSDTLDWIAEQEWSDGKVGMIGGSYGGYVQWAAAASGNPHLKAMVSLVTSGSPFVDNPRKGGTFMSGILAWCLLIAERDANPCAMARNDWDEVVSYRPVKDIPERILGKRIPFWDEWVKHETNDEFWQKCDWSLHGDKIDVPALMVSGWYDDDGQGTSQAWDMMRKYNREDIKLILGPWYHQANTTRDIHNIPFGDNAICYDMDINYLRWFDRYLKDIENGIDNTPRVKYYLVGNNEWQQADDWPPKNAKLEAFYLRENGKLSSTPPKDAETPDSYIFDPDDPAPHLVDISENELNVPENYNEVEKRSDVIIYTSEPLKEDLAIAGDIYANLYAASDAKDTDWVVRITDVDNAGNSFRVADGILRACFRNGFEKSELLTPGKVEKYRIRLTRAGYVFKKGHKIRIQVTSGAKNLAFPNCNTGEDPTHATVFISAKQTIYHDDKYPSNVELPVIKG